MAKDYLAIQGLSVPSERVFSLSDLKKGGHCVANYDIDPPMLVFLIYKSK